MAKLGAETKNWNFFECQRSPQGGFTYFFVDNGDELTVTDKHSGLVWQLLGLELASLRTIKIVGE